MGAQSAAKGYVRQSFQQLGIDQVVKREVRADGMVIASLVEKEVVDDGQSEWSGLGWGSLQLSESFDLEFGRPK